MADGINLCGVTLHDDQNAISLLPFGPQGAL